VSQAVQGFREELAEVAEETSQLWSQQELADQELQRLEAARRREQEGELARLEAARRLEQERREQREAELQRERERQEQEGELARLEAVRRLEQARESEAALERSCLDLAATVEGLEARLVAGATSVGDLAGRLQTQVVSELHALDPRPHALAPLGPRP